MPCITSRLQNDLLSIDSIQKERVWLGTQGANNVYDWNAGCCSDYTFWGGGQPNDTDQECAWVSIFGSYDWFDDACDATNVECICQG